MSQAMRFFSIQVIRIVEQLIFKEENNKACNLIRKLIFSFQSADGNVFQLALMIGDTMTFAHIVYSKLNSHLDAVVSLIEISFLYF